MARARGVEAWHSCRVQGILEKATTERGVLEGEGVSLISATRQGSQGRQHGRENSKFSRSEKLQTFGTTSQIVVPYTSRKLLLL